MTRDEYEALRAKISSILDECVDDHYRVAHESCEQIADRILALLLPGPCMPLTEKQVKQMFAAIDAASHPKAKC